MVCLFVFFLKRKDVLVEARGQIKVLDACLMLSAPEIRNTTKL